MHELCDQNFPNWTNHTLAREGVPFKFMGKKEIKAAYTKHRDEHFCSSASGFNVKTLWRSFDDTNGAIKLNQFIGPGSNTPGEFYCIYPEKLKAYLLEHHPKKYDQVDGSHSRMATLSSKTKRLRKQAFWWSDDCTKRPLLPQIK